MKAPKRCHLRLACAVKRVGRIGYLGMLRSHVDAVDHLETCAFDRGEQLLPRSEAEMLREIGEDEPAFAAGFEVRGEAAQEAMQHAAFGIVDAVLERRARAP